MRSTTRIGMVISCLVIGLACAATTAPQSSGVTPRAATWKPAAAPLSTRFAKDVDPRAPLPEYPRPELARDEWLNLNGLWSFTTPSDDAPPKLGDAASFDGSILVPYPIESSLSGVGRHAERVVYRRTFALPAAWKGRRTLLNFGAVDWRARVWVDGAKVGEHEGGYDAFSFDITDRIAADRAEHELVVDVWDPTDAGGQPIGKQRRAPQGIWYSAVTGIWQTVWLEPVRDAHLARLRCSSALADGAKPARANFDVEVAGWKEGDTLELSASVEGATLRANSGSRHLELDLPKAKAWTPDKPTLYDLEIALVRDGKPLDRVHSYFAVRRYEVRDVNGNARLCLNGDPTFLVGVLDQGWWPDGLYTAPTDAALASDVEAMKKLGFNLARKHVKVEPARWYYHCDRLGLCVWQDMPSPRDQGNPDAKAFERELRAMVDGLAFHPSIVQWIVFNEGWGQHDTQRYVDLVRALDPTRVITDASGWTHADVGDVFDIHNYPSPTSTIGPAGIAVVLGEFGGIGLRVKDHLWQANSWGYREDENPTMLASSYTSLLRRAHDFNKRAGLAAAVYTQLTDVEGEINGLLTYDREYKADPGWFARANRGPHPALQVILSDARFDEPVWRFTLEKPADGWQAPEFDDSKFQSGRAGFGTQETPGALVRTEWNTGDIWLRRKIDFEPTTSLDDLYLSVHHDEDCEIYFNGVLAAKLSGFTTDYEEVPIRREARDTLKTGANILAVHCKQTSGGQYIDVGLVAIVWPTRK